MLIRLGPSSCCLLLIALVLGACAPSNDGIDPAGETFSAIAVDEVITMSGTEPFWSIVIENGRATYADPERPKGQEFPVARFAGNNGLGFSGEWDGSAVAIALTPGQCSDGMSDRIYPYVATIALGEKTLRGCGHTSSQPFTGSAAP